MNIEISNNNIKAQINTQGAELNRLEKNNKNYIWDIEETFWNKTSPILFPIVGKLKDDSYSINKKVYQLPRHGFAREFEFEIIAQEESTLTLSLKSNTLTLKIYPFEFELTLKYTLKENQLLKEYSVKNLGNEEMPFSIGAHPAFAIDFKKSKYSIEFGNENSLISHQLENELFSGKTSEIELNHSQLSLEYSLFEKDAIVLKNLKSREIKIYEDNLPYLKFDLGNFPHLGIWTKVDAPFLCIEPWHGYADNATSNRNILEKEAIQKLKPQQAFSAFYTIEIL